MKKLLLLSVAFLAVIGAKAQTEEENVITYNFYSSFEYCAVLEEEWMANYDFIDNTGSTINMEGITLAEPVDHGEAYEEYLPYGISLNDGEMHLRTDLEASGDVFIGWGTTGPSRVVWMYGWDNIEGSIGAGNYGPETDDDWVPSKNAINFLRNANTSYRQDTYLQFPAVTGPHTLNVWVGSQGGSRAENLCLIATPVIDGVEGDVVTLVNESGYPEKSFRKVSTSYSGDKSVAWRVGCNGMEVYVVYLTIEMGASDTDGIHEIVATSEADAAIYNLQGMRVDSNYKGVVIKNGKKYIQK